MVLLQNQFLNLMNLTEEKPFEISHHLLWQMYLNFESSLDFELGQCIDMHNFRYQHNFPCHNSVFENWLILHQLLKVRQTCPLVSILRNSWGKGTRIMGLNNSQTKSITSRHALIFMNFKEGPRLPPFTLYLFLVLFLWRRISQLLTTRSGLTQQLYL